MRKGLVVLLVAAMSGSGLVVAQEQDGYRLEELYRMAEENSQQIKVSKAGVDVSAEELKSAKSARFPEVELEASGSYTGNALLMSRGFSTSGTSTVIVPGAGPQQVANGKQDIPHWGNSFTARVTQVIYADGAVRSGVRMAELGMETATLDVARNTQEIRFLIAGYVLDLYSMENQVDVIDRNIELTEQLIGNIRAHRSQGTVLANDITRYDLELKSLQLSRKRLCDAMAIMEYQLATTLHLPADTELRIDKEDIERRINALTASMLGTESDWQQQADTDNIALKQMSLATEMAEQAVVQAHSSSLPSVALVAENDLFGPYTNDLIPVNSNVNVWFVGIGIKYNLSSIWNNRHSLKSARAKSTKAYEELVLGKESVREGVHACYVNMLTSFSEVETREKEVELAGQNYEVIKNRYDNELALLTDMLDASNTKLSAEMSLVDARINLLYNYFKLKYTTSNL